MLSLLLQGCANPAISTPSEYSSERELTDGGFLSHVPCGPPCFYDVTSGKTTKSGVKAAISSYDHVFTNCTDWEAVPAGTGGHEINCDQKRISISYSGDTVDGSSFSPVNLTIGQVIQLL